MAPSASIIIAWTGPPADATAAIAAECAAANPVRPGPACANFDVFPGGPYIHSKTALP